MVLAGVAAPPASFSLRKREDEAGIGTAAVKGQRAAGAIRTTYLQFDELETFEHTKLKPLSVALAVRVKTGQIIAARVDALAQNRRTRPRDPLFAVNHACAMLRADVSRLARRTWVTSKNAEGLQKHLDVYLAWSNGYKL